jgi:hypothetical protein
VSRDLDIVSTTLTALVERSFNRAMRVGALTEAYYK